MNHLEYSCLNHHQLRCLYHQQLEKHLGFDLLLSVKPTLSGQLNLIADYTYQAERFKDRQQPTPLQLLSKIGAAEPAGIGGRLMDRCMDTLDYDSLIERLRAALGGMPRNVMLVTGPSRSADIEQTLELGAHGPRRLHVVLVDPQRPDTGFPDPTGYDAVIAFGSFAHEGTRPHR